jgi:PKD repeat protein
MFGQHLRSVSAWFGIPFLFAIAASSARAAILHVQPNGNDAANGAAWAQAKKTVGAALNAAASGDQVWVAAGTYVERVTIKGGVALYGGFAGSETTLDQRDAVKNRSILNGGTNGVVISMTGAGPGTRVDGLVITGGSGILGGGISSVTSSPVIANNRIVQNTVNAGAGAGIYITGAFLVSTTQAFQPVITNNLIYANRAFGDGAGIAVDCASPLIANNVVLFNLASGNCGGIGFWRATRAIVTDNLIEANAAGAVPGSLGLGGGILATSNDLNGRPCATCSDCASVPTIANNIIAANGAQDGGGVFLGDAKLQNPTGAIVVNNTIVANTGSGILWVNTGPAIYNNIVTFNSGGLQRNDTSEATIENNDVYGNTVLGAVMDYVGLPAATGQNGNISGDPIFANYQIGDFHLQSASPCINAGLNAAVLAGWPEIGGGSRVVGGVVDIGANESIGTSYNVPNPLVRVSPNGNDANDGLTWATAKKTVEGGISAVAASLVKGGEVWVAGGTYTNHISIPAFVYVYGGFAGNESTRDARDYRAHPTVLDGAGHPQVVIFESSGYLVSALDGFTVQNGGVYTGGQAVFTGGGAGPGGGISCSVSGPVIANNRIQFNSIGTPFNSVETSLGAGIYCYVAHAQILNNTFANNEVLDVTAGSGGGIYMSQSKPTITANVFVHNAANYGPALSGFVSSMRFLGNTVVSNAMYVSPIQQPYSGGTDGAVFLTACTNFVIQGNTLFANVANFGGGLDLKECEVGEVSNNLIIGNSAYNVFAMIGWGGGIFCEMDARTLPGNLIIMNNTIVGNYAPGIFGSDQGGGVSLTLGTNSLVLVNNIIAFNSGGVYAKPGTSPPSVFSNNCLTNPINYVNLAPGTGDIHVDPRFVNPPGGNYHLLAGSLCVDAGTSLFVPAIDYDGVPRPIDGNGDGVATVDVGAFEFVPASSTPPSVQFASDRTNGPAPLTVTFTNLTTGIVTNYLWNFGDNSTSVAANPIHTFSTPDYFTVSLTASGPGGANQLARTNYISVTGKSPPLVLSAFGFTGNQFQFIVSGPVGSSITVQGSTDLRTWAPLTTLPNTTGIVQFQDTNSTQTALRFYRAAMQQ